MTSLFQSVSRRRSGLAVCLFGAAVAGYLLHDPVRSGLRWIKHSLVPVRVAHPNYIYSDRMNSIFAALETNAPIVMLGDSRIEEGPWAELFGNPKISNRGISGDTVEGVAGRLTQAMPSDVQLCILQIGFNDILQGVAPEIVAESYKVLIDEIRARKQSVILIMSTIFGGRTYDSVNSRIRQLNIRLEAVANGDDVLWLDVNRRLSPNGYLEAGFTNDDIHLNGIAYLSVLKPLLDPYIGSAHE
ncbi:MAG: hypothetical protein H7A43_06155 [Verrucomicrobia bacterium]|nr:hypothetical protein [Verrucomicrobiota bacterium]